ncbi:MAG: DHA2 family efflux MFS transporter permease subunit [Mycobacteriaceae bacterium]|nr:DHA2 family efflux MFS transporter permease subunit [Mycobacteriaceae bacterium]
MPTAQGESGGASNRQRGADAGLHNPWLALSALIVGFFMILLDMTIVAVANPAIMRALHTNIGNVIWVTSAYLLTYAVPLLVTGRLGDKFGPKNVYLAGLAVFTLASLWCGLSGSVGMLIAARAVQGLGAALMTPQTMAVITRTFPPDRRGAAMGLWGGVAGLATLVGPILGGVLVDRFGWEWIFFVNVPVGVAAFLLAAWLVPALPTHDHKFDLVDVLLSAVGMTLLVFGIQEGNTRHWAWWIWAMIGAGLVVLAVFGFHQSRTGEPLVPLSLFRDRNFALSNVAIMAMGAAVTSLMVPSYFYLQAVRGMSPTKSALVFAPMAVVTGLLAPLIGRRADRMHPALTPAFGFALYAGSLAWLATMVRPHSSIAWMMPPIVGMGVANACIWAPLAAVATRDLPVRQAGAGAGVYNTTRQVGSVLGSAAISALITSRLAAHLPGMGGAAAEGGMAAAVPEALHDPFSAALRDSLFLPVAVLVAGFAAAALFGRSATALPDPTPSVTAAEA